MFAVPTLFSLRNIVIKNMKILLIDDDGVFRLTTKIVLSKMSHKRIVARNGLIGVKLAIKDRPNLILSDYAMPGMSGDKVFIKLKLFLKHKKFLLSSSPMIFASVR